MIIVLVYVSLDTSNKIDNLSRCLHFKKEWSTLFARLKKNQSPPLFYSANHDQVYHSFEIEEFNSFYRLHNNLPWPWLTLRPFISFISLSPTNSIIVIRIQLFLPPRHTSSIQPSTEISKSLAAQAEAGKNVCEKGPVMLLHEIFNAVQFECLASDGPQHSKFRIQVEVNDMKFEGTGMSAVIVARWIKCGGQ